MTVVAAATAVCDSIHYYYDLHKARPFQVALLILDSRPATTTFNVT